MTFHPDLETAASQDGRDAGQGRVSAVQQFGLAAVEEPNFAQADHQALGSDPHLDFMLADFVAEGGFQLMPQFVDVNPEAGSPFILLGAPATLIDWSGASMSSGRGFAGASGNADTFGRRASEHTQLLKRSLDGGRYLGGFFLSACEEA